MSRRATWSVVRRVRLQALILLVTELARMTLARLTQQLEHVGMRSTSLAVDLPEVGRWLMVCKSLVARRVSDVGAQANPVSVDASTSCLRPSSTRCYEEARGHAPMGTSWWPPGIADVDGDGKPNIVLEGDEDENHWLEVVSVGGRSGVRSSPGSVTTCSRGCARSDVRCCRRTAASFV